MDQQTIAKIRACAQYLRETRLPIGELEAIDRLLGCVQTLETIAKEMDGHEAGNQ